MSTRGKVASILVGLTILSAVLTSGLEAKGGSIAITGHQRPGSGDPVYEYVFDVTLQSNSSIQLGDSFTIESLIGITPADFPTFGDQGSSSSAPTNWLPTIGPVTVMSAPYASDLTWTFNGNTPISTALGSVDLGQFTVVTAVVFPTSPPYANGALVEYSYTIGGQTSTGSGFFPMTVVPEPSSLIMLVTGIAVVLLLLPICRHRRQSQFLTA